MKGFKTLTVMAAGALALSALPQVASGAYEFSDSMIVINTAGIVVGNVSEGEGDEIANPDHVWKMDSGIANANAWGHATLVYESTIEGNTIISDIFGVAHDPSDSDPIHFYLGFMSDENLSLATAEAWFGPQYNASGGSNWSYVTETLQNQGVFDAIQYVDLTFAGGVRSATFTSPVPEPTTMIAGALLLLPFGASTIRILRKRQTA